MSSWPITTTTLKRINDNCIKNEPTQTTTEKTTKNGKLIYLHCSSSHNCIKLCMAIQCGVHVYEQHSRINCCVAECFVAKLRWCLTEQVCQGSKVWSALAIQRTGYCAKIYKNLPLRRHACVQESALVCARPPECAHM